MVQGISNLGKAQLVGTPCPSGLCHTSVVSGHQLVLLLWAGQPRAGWEVAEAGGVHGVAASFQEGKTKDAGGVGSGQGQGQSYHVLLPTVNHRVSPDAWDEETDPAFVGGALRGRTGAILSIYHKILETNDVPRLMGHREGGRQVLTWRAIQCSI